MKNPSTNLLAILALLLPLAANPAEAARVERRAPGMRFVTDLDAAIAEAKARNIPLFVAYHKDH